MSVGGVGIWSLYLAMTYPLQQVAQAAIQVSLNADGGDGTVIGVVGQLDVGQALGGLTTDCCPPFSGSRILKWQGHLKVRVSGS